MPRRPGPPALVEDVGRKGLDENVADKIRESILKGDFAAGSHLVELDLASRWDVSQGTIRAALKILQHEGLVEYRPRRGNFVSEVTSADIFEIYTLRDALEALGARLAAEHIDEAGHRSLERALQNLRSGAVSGNRRRVMELDFEFHRTVLQLSRHRRLIEMYALIEAQTRMFMAMTDRFHHDLTEVSGIHEPIAQAIYRGDGELASRLSSRHNERDGQKLVTALAESEAAEYRKPSLKQKRRG